MRLLRAVAFSALAATAGIGISFGQTPATTAPARVEYGDPARLIGLMLAQGSATFGLMVAVVGLVIMTRWVCSVNWNCWRCGERS